MPILQKSCRGTDDAMLFARGLVWLTLLFLLLAASVDGAIREQTITQDKIADFLRHHVLENGPWKPDFVEVRVVAFQPVTLPAGVVHYRIVRPTHGVTPGWQSFLIAADVAGKERTRFWVKSEVKVYEDVVVSSYPLMPSATINPEDVRLERRDITGLNGRPITRIEEAVGRQPAHMIAINQTLTQRSLDRPTLVRRGNVVTLVYESGSLRVETPGFADESGKAGDLIQVKNSTSGKLLRGVLIDGRSVRVN